MSNRRLIVNKGTSSTDVNFVFMIKGDNRLSIKRINAYPQSYPLKKHTHDILYEK
jgi:hypothetical protein